MILSDALEVKHILRPFGICCVCFLCKHDGSLKVFLDSVDGYFGPGVWSTSSAGWRWAKISSGFPGSKSLTMAGFYGDICWYNWAHQQANLVICCLRAASCQSIDSTRWYKAEIAIPWLATLCVIHSDFLALEKGRTKQHETTTIWHQLTSNFDLKSSDYHLPAPDKMVQRYARICIYIIYAYKSSRTWTSWYWCTDTLKNFSVAVAGLLSWCRAIWHWSPQVPCVARQIRLAAKNCLRDGSFN